MQPTTAPATAPDSPFAGLSAPQAKVALAVAAGTAITQAAADAGVHRSTVYDWIQSHPAFTEAVEEARLDYIDLLRNQLRAMSAKALSRIESLIDDPNTPPSVALRAALAILERPRFPAQSWSLPEPVYTPEEEQCAHQLAALDADYKAFRQQQQLAQAQAHAHAQAKSDTIRHDPTESRTSPQSPPQLPRNAPCPCGSGKKYKRCCRPSAPPVHGAAGGRVW